MKIKKLPNGRCVIKVGAPEGDRLKRADAKYSATFCPDSKLSGLV